MNQQEWNEDRLMILYVLKRMEYPLSNPQLSQIIVSNGWCDYFDLQVLLQDLLDSKMLKIDESPNGGQRYMIGLHGYEAVDLFSNRLPMALLKRIDAFCAQYRSQYVSQAESIADYRPAPDGGFLVHLRFMEFETQLLDMTIRIMERDQAQTICQNWVARAGSAYATLLPLLLDPSVEIET